MLTEYAHRAVLPALFLLLLACWLGGGVTVDDTGIDEGLQLLALPVLLLAVWRLLMEGGSPWVRVGVVAALLIVLVPALQLLPIPMALWQLPPARQALAADLAKKKIRKNDKEKY